LLEKLFWISPDLEKLNFRLAFSGFHPMASNQADMQAFEHDLMKIIDCFMPPALKSNQTVRDIYLATAMKNIKEGTWTKTEREFYKLILERDENWAARNEASARGLPTDDLSEKIRATIKAFCSVSIEMRGSRFTRGLGNGRGLLQDLHEYVQLPEEALCTREHEVRGGHLPDQRPSPRKVFLLGGEVQPPVRINNRLKTVLVMPRKTFS
jgi:hypothetical protein